MTKLLELFGIRTPESKQHLPDHIKQEIHNRRYNATEINRGFSRVKQRMQDDAKSVSA